MCPLNGEGESQTIKEGIKLYIPHKVCKPKNSQPWINTVIKKMMKRRDRMYKAYKKSKDQSFAKKFKTLKQEIQKQTRRAYWTYVKKLFTPSEDDHEYSATKRFSLISSTGKQKTMVFHL